MMKLQKIVSLKFLGYSLEQIKEMLRAETFDLSLKQSLLEQKTAFENKKEQIETALKAIDRTISLLEEEGEVDASVLASLIRSMQTEKEQREWLEQRVSKETVEQLYDKSDEEMLALDKVYIRLTNKAKKLAGKPPEDPEVQNMLDEYMKRMRFWAHTVAALNRDNPKFNGRRVVAFSLPDMNRGFVYRC